MLASLVVLAATLQPLSDAQVIARSELFLKELAAIDSSQAMSGPCQLNPYKRDPSDPCFYVYYSSAFLAVDRSDGSIQQYLYCPPSHNPLPWPEHPLAKDALVALANKYAALGRIPGPIHVYDTERTNDQDPTFQVDFVGIFSGLPLMTLYPSYVKIDPSNGRLLDAEFHKQPIPPKDLKAKTTGEAAKRLFLRYAYTAKWERKGPYETDKLPSRLVEKFPPTLCIYMPYKHQWTSRDSFFTKDQIEAAKTGHGLLVWNLEYDVPRSEWPEVQGFFAGYVDAKTGKLLYFNGYTYSQAGYIKLHAQHEG